MGKLKILLNKRLWSKIKILKGYEGNYFLIFKVRKLTSPKNHTSHS